MAEHRGQRGRPGFFGLEFSSSNHVQIKNKVHQRNAGIKFVYLDTFHNYFFRISKNEIESF